MGRQWSSDEERRLAILRSFDILDTPPEETFDAITRVAAHVAAAPIALVSLIDRDRQWFKSRHGLETSETARELAFCDHALGAAEPLVVEDAALDDRFSQNPLVSSDPHIRFYAGFPVNAVEGTGLGTLCVIDRKPRQLTAEQREIMLSLARHVEVQLEVRRLARNHAEANALLDAVTDHAPVMLFLKDAESLNVTLWNREAERVSGIRREEILGKTGYESFPAAEMDGFHERDRRVLDELVMVEAEETLTGPNGARVLHTRKIPLIGSEGKAKHLLGISTDITALRERDRELAKIHATLEDRVKQRTAELEAANARLTEALAERDRALAALRKTQEQFLQAQKLESLGRLAGGVAHDFNNLLTAIFSFGSFALESVPVDSPAHEDMQEVLTAAKRAETLTRQLLAFSRKQIIAPRIVNVTTHMVEMDKMLRRILGEDVEVATILASDLWDTKVDPGALEQVVVNLAVNSRDAMPTGGKLTIETVNARLGANYGDQQVPVPPGDYVCLSVTDTGHGMDAATQKQIFEPFFTTKEQGKGTGLGLATCYGIVKQANGYVWVYSEPGNGATFKVYLPRATEGQRDESKPRVQLFAPTEGGKTILVAEDDDQLRRVAVRTLREQGFEVFEANCGQRGLALGERADPIDLLVTDVVMPGMSGKQLADRLALRHPSMRVLFMSGYTSNSIVHHGVLEEGIEFLHKPFTPHDLARRVREVLDSGAPAEERQPSVLLIDDDIGLLRSLQRSLEESWAVQLARGGLAARDLLRHNDYDLIVCDVLMPDLGGVELYEELKTARPDVVDRFVFMTGADPETVRGLSDFFGERKLVWKSALVTSLNPMVAERLESRGEGLPESQG